MRFGYAVDRIDERIPGIDLPLMSVSQTRGVIRRSELTDKPHRADTLDIYKVCRRGDIVFNKMSIRSGAMGVAREDGLVTYHYEVMRPREWTDPRFVVYLMKSSWFTGELIKRERGIGAGGQGNVRTTEVPFSVLKTINSHIPGTAEQRAVADYLDYETAQIDALVAKQEEFIGLALQRRAAAIERAINLDDASSPRVRLKYMIKRVDQGISPQADAGRLAIDGWGVLKTGCVNGGVFRQTEHKSLPSDFPVDLRMEVRIGDLIVSRANGSPKYVGAAAVVKELNFNLILSDKLFRLVPRDDVDVRYLAWSMNSVSYREQVESLISGAVGLANNLPLSSLRSIRLAWPELSEQRRIVTYLEEVTSRIDTLISKAEEHIALAKERRSALITAAVTGQIDVRSAAQKAS